MAQVVVGEDEETGLQVTVDFFQILEEMKREKEQIQKHPKTTSDTASVQKQPGLFHKAQYPFSMIYF